MVGVGGAGKNFETGVLSTKSNDHASCLGLVGDGNDDGLGLANVESIGNLRPGHVAVEDGQALASGQCCALRIDFDAFVLDAAVVAIIKALELDFLDAALFLDEPNLLMA